MKQYKLMGVLVFIGVFVFVFSGCVVGNSGSGDNSDNGEVVEVEMVNYNFQFCENFKEGGEVNFVICEVLLQLNVFNSDGSVDIVCIVVWYMLQFILMKLDGMQYKNDNYLFEWKNEVKDGKIVLIFMFMDEVYWNDGMDMDWIVIDVMWKVNCFYDEGFNLNVIDGYKDIEFVEQGDMFKMVIVIFKSEFVWLQMFFNGGVIYLVFVDLIMFNEVMVENLYFEWGVGLYIVDEFDVNKGYIFFKLNFEWWGDVFLFDKVMMIGMDGQVGVNVFKNGEVDMVEMGFQEFIDQVKDVDGVKVYCVQQIVNIILQVDLIKLQFEDVKVCEVFFKVINIDQQKQIVWNGFGYEEDLVGLLILFFFQFGYKDFMKVVGWEFDVEGVKKFFDEVGWIEGFDGICEKDGVKFFVVYLIWSDIVMQKVFVQLLQVQEKEVGIDVKVEVCFVSQFFDDYILKNWDVFGFCFILFDLFGVVWFCQLYCLDFGFNLLGVGDVEFDVEIKDKVELQSDFEVQIVVVMEFEFEIYKCWGLILFYNGLQIYMVQEGLVNLIFEFYVGFDFFGIQLVENVGWEK